MGGARERRRPQCDAQGGFQPAAWRAKAFGLNALKLYPVPQDVLDRHPRSDAVATLRDDCRNAPDPRFATYGPKTRREFLNLRAWGA